MRSFKLIVNPNAGDGKATELAEQVREKLKAAGIAETQGKPDTIVILGGDGTIYEHLNSDSFDANVPLVIVPAGTANALFSFFYPGETHILRSLDSAIKGDKSSLRPLPLAGINESKTACVIVSTALHACILYDSEELRKEHSGLERFKMAAEKNMQHLSPGHLKLEGSVRRYSPASKAFESESSTLELEGPFSYLLLGALTDRLEPTFVVAPLRFSDKEPGLDVVAIRPRKSQGSEELFKAVTPGMYEEGKHVQLVYAEDGIRHFKAGDEKLDTVVEYFRCSRVTYKPSAKADDDIRKRLLCIDGFCEEIKPGEPVTVEAHKLSPSIWL